MRQDHREDHPLEDNRETGGGIPWLLPLASTSHESNPSPEQRTKEPWKCFLQYTRKTGAGCSSSKHGCPGSMAVGLCSVPEPPGSKGWPQPAACEELGPYSGSKKNQIQGGRQALKPFQVPYIPPKGPHNDNNHVTEHRGAKGQGQGIYQYVILLAQRILVTSSPWSSLIKSKESQKLSINDNRKRNDSEGNVTLPKDPRERNLCPMKSRHETSSLEKMLQQEEQRWACCRPCEDFHRKRGQSRAWWCRPGIPVLRGLRRENCQSVWVTTKPNQGSIIKAK
ncbi:mCG147287, partial [Mus musculus]